MEKFKFLRYLPTYDSEGHKVRLQEVFCCQSQRELDLINKEVELYAPAYNKQIEEAKQLAAQRIVNLENQVDDLNETIKKLNEKIAKLERILDDSLAKELGGN